MSEQPDEKNTQNTAGVDDEQLPDDLVPSEENPLAEGLEPGETVDDLLTGGKEAETAEGIDGAEPPPSSDDSGDASQSD